MLANIKSFLKQNKYKILGGVSVLLSSYFLYQYLQDESQTKLSSFIQAVNQDQVKEVIINQNTLFFRSDNSQWFRTFLGDFPHQNIFSIIKNKNITFSVEKQNAMKDTIPTAITCIGSCLMFKFITQHVNKSIVSSIDPKGNDGNRTTLDDYFGGDDIKEKFRETIDFLKNPNKYEQMGARIRRGILFYGPPGTGKTMLARALANEAGCQFFRMVAAEFQQLYVGVGAKRVRQLFKLARQCKEGCIIFIDEIDALGSRMNHLRDSHETTTTINQFLNQMDGFTANQNIVIVAATNRLDLVDSAILRSGRFDIKIHVPLPNLAQRKGIFQTLLHKKVGSHQSVQTPMINFISESSQNWCGADLQTLINESIYKAIAQNTENIEDHHILQAYEEMHQLR